MPFDTTCPHCGRAHDAMPDTAAGTMIRCRSCFKPFTAIALATSRREREAGEPVDAGPAEPAPEPETPVGRDDLRAAVARLVELKRKSGALVARHPELADLEPALDTVLRALRAGRGPRGEPLELREVALPLGTWARRLDRLGLPVLSRELGHVERTLAEADEGRARGSRPERSEPGPARLAGQGLRSESAARPAGEDARPEGRGRPLLPVVGISAVLVAVALGAMVVLRRSSVPPPPAAPQAQPVATSAPPSPSPRPTATPPAADFEPLAYDLSRLVEAASQAQLAAQRGDLDGAVGRLEEAARLDPTRAEVRAAAQAIVDEMTARAAKDHSEGRFDEAEAQLLEAQRLSGRFLLDATALDASLQRLRTAERTVRIRPAERDRLAGAVGRLVEVRMAGREVRTGTLTAVEGDSLVVEVHDTVGSGEVAYSVRVPLAQVELVLYRYTP